MVRAKMARTDGIARHSNDFKRAQNPRAPSHSSGRPQQTGASALPALIGVANASVCSLRAVCGRRSIPSLGIRNMKTKRYLRSTRDQLIFSAAVINGVLAALNMSVGAYLGAAVSGPISVGSFLFVFLFPDERWGGDSSAYSGMIEQLARMGKSLGEVSAFLEQERAKVAEAERTLNELQKEKAELEPVIATQRQTVDAILAAYAARGRVSAWKDRIVGFSLGVISSLIAAFIWEALTKR